MSKEETLREWADLSASDEESEMSHTDVMSWACDPNSGAAFTAGADAIALLRRHEFGDADIRYGVPVNVCLSCAAAEGSPHRAACDWKRITS